jgi:predicted nucleotide-binding protein
MARRSTSSPPEDRSRSVPEMRSGIERLTRRIEELKAFDPQSVSTHRSSEIVSLETAIEDTLAAVFGQGTPKFKRYRPACDLEPSPTLSLTPGWIGVRGGGGGRSGENPHELRHGIDERKKRALALLEQAVRGLEEEIEQRPPEPAFGLDEGVSQRTAPTDAHKVFVVHGHDEAALQAVARFLEQIGLEAIILREQPDQGRATIEKFEDCAADVGFAVVLLTPDDLAGPATSPAAASRARQNAIFELGYFAGKLGRGRTCLLRKGEVEIPSDLYGVIYTDMDAADGWKIKLVRELKAAKLDFDANKMWS